MSDGIHTLAPVTAYVIAPGVIKCRILWRHYPMVGLHWRDQLTGANRRKWGRIYIDCDKAEQHLRRREAVSPLRKRPRAKMSDQEKLEADVENIDECPGAMFIWETQEDADIMPLCAYSNQKFGRELYNALRAAVGVAMEKELGGKPPKRSHLDWWEVKFEFA